MSKTACLSTPNPFDLIADQIKARGWTQGTMENHKGEVCLTGAAKVSALLPGEWLIVRSVLQHRKHAEGWNDQPERTKQQVLDYLCSDAPPITGRELRVIYSPQWREVCTFIRRCAVITLDEAKRMGAARDAAWGAARDAAWGAARDAARDAAWGAARNAAWGAAWGAARGAARGAASGLVVRDLIGKHGFTQAHYDTLTKPWRTVVGTLHPQDADL